MADMIDTDAPAARQRETATTNLVPVRVWDLPTRLFHWALVLLIGGAWLTQHYGWMQWHEWLGYATAAALIFRLAWGIFGSESARFSQFLRSPLAAAHHLAHVLRREQDTNVTHNAAGGYMVLVMLTLLVVQVATGSCANDEVSTQGPFADRVGAATSDWLSHVHAVNFRLLELLIALHVAVTLLYRVIKGQNLIGPMITGWKWLPKTIAPPRQAGWLRAVVTLCGAAAVVVAAISWFGS